MIPIPIVGYGIAVGLCILFLCVASAKGRRIAQLDQEFEGAKGSPIAMTHVRNDQRAIDLRRQGWCLAALGSLFGGVALTNMVWAAATALENGQSVAYALLLGVIVIFLTGLLALAICAGVAAIGRIGRR